MSDLPLNLVEPERVRLLARYRQLVLAELPRRAVAEGWVVHADHCFGRIVLDNTVGGCWYDVLDRRRSPAFAQLDDDSLRTAVAIAEQVRAGGDVVLRELNERSLSWRRRNASAMDEIEPQVPGTISSTTGQAKRDCPTN